jgi:hypothetical protein
VAVAEPPGGWLADVFGMAVEVHSSDGKGDEITQVPCGTWVT